MKNPADRFGKPICICTIDKVCDMHKPLVESLARDTKIEARPINCGPFMPKFRLVAVRKEVRYAREDGSEFSEWETVYEGHPIGD